MLCANDKPSTFRRINRAESPSESGTEGTKSGSRLMSRMERAESEEAGRFVTERENEKETFSPEAKFQMLIILALDIHQNRIPTRKLEHQRQGLGEDMWIFSGCQG